MYTQLLCQEILKAHSVILMGNWDHTETVELVEQLKAKGLVPEGVSSEVRHLMERGDAYGTLRLITESK
jgi:hypothetical protein